jgi:hypothetical protein
MSRDMWYVPTWPASGCSGVEAALREQDPHRIDATWTDKTSVARSPSVAMSRVGAGLRGVRRRLRAVLDGTRHPAARIMRRARDRR